MAPIPSRAARAPAIVSTMLLLLFSLISGQALSLVHAAPYFPKPDLEKARRILKRLIGTSEVPPNDGEGMTMIRRDRAGKPAPPTDYEMRLLAATFSKEWAYRRTRDGTYVLYAGEQHSVRAPKTGTTHVHPYGMFANRASVDDRTFLVGKARILPLGSEPFTYDADHQNLELTSRIKKAGLILQAPGDTYSYLRDGYHRGKSPLYITDQAGFFQRERGYYLNANTLEDLVTLDRLMGRVKARKGRWSMPRFGLDFVGRLPGLSDTGRDWEFRSPKCLSIRADGRLIIPEGALFRLPALVKGQAYPAPVPSMIEPVRVGRHRFYHHELARLAKMTAAAMRARRRRGTKRVGAKRVGAKRVGAKRPGGGSTLY